MTINLFIEGLKKGQKKFGNDIAVIVNSILLTITYFIGVGLTSVASKIVNKKFLDKKIEAGRKTYWEPLNLATKPTKEYYRQF